MISLTRSLVAAVLVSSVGPLVGWAGASSWKQLETRRFEIVYEASHRSTAILYAQAAERAYDILLPIFKTPIRGKIPLAIVDHSDNPNGMATFLPYPLVAVYPVLPGPGDSLSNYHDWPFEMMIHELTHIFSMHQASGFYRPLRWLFGSTVRPNALLPRWHLEGIAVVMESLYPGHGRLYSPWSGAWIRALVQKQQLSNETLASINESAINTAPFFDRPYLFGSFLWAQLLHEHPSDVIANIYERTSRRVPFLINSPFQETTGYSYQELLARTIDTLTTNAQGQLNRVANESKAINNIELPFSEFIHLLEISPGDQSLALHHSFGQRRRVIRIVDRAAASKSWQLDSEKHLFAASGVTRLTWKSPTVLCFDMITAGRLGSNETAFRDVFVYNTETRKIQQLTFGERVQSPTCDPFSDRIAYVQLKGMGSALVTKRVLGLSSNFDDAQKGADNSAKDKLALAPEKAMTLHTAVNSERIANPEFLKDGSLVYSVRQAAGIESLLRYDWATNRKTVLQQIPTEVARIKRTDSGFFAITSQTGTYNAFSYSHTGIPQGALTNSPTLTTDAAFDGLTHSLLHSELYGSTTKLLQSPWPKSGLETAIQPTQLKPLLTVPQDRIVKTEGTALQSSLPSAATSQSQLEIHEGSYPYFQYLLPHFWIPFVYPLENGGVVIQALTGSQDPAGLTRYQLEAGYDSLTERLSYGLDVENQILPVTLNLKLLDRPDYLPASDETFTQRQQSLAIGDAVSDKWRPFGLPTTWHLTGKSIETKTPRESLERLGFGAQMDVFDSGESFRIAPLKSFNLGLAYNQFIGGGHWIPYSQYQTHLDIKSYVSKRGRAQISFQSTLIHSANMAKKHWVDLGEKTLGGQFLAATIQSQTVMRGYPSGTFSGKSLWKSTLEWTVPVSEWHKGYGLWPLFFRDLDASFFIDALELEGGVAQRNSKVYKTSRFGEFYTATGVELKLGATAAYHLPLQFTLGLYYGFNEDALGGFLPFLGLGYSGFSGVRSHQGRESF